MKDTRICDNCGAEHPISKMFEVEGDWLCEDCADRLAVVCDHCGDRIYQESAVEDDHHTLCEGCFDEHYVRCHDCGCILRSYDAYFDDDDLPIARTAGTSTRARFTTTTIRPTLCSTARACGILA